VQILEAEEIFSNLHKYVPINTLLFVEGAASWLQSLWPFLEVFEYVIVSVSSGAVGPLNTCWQCHMIASRDAGCVIDGN
jgi:hypothetical protein